MIRMNKWAALALLSGVVASCAIEPEIDNQDSSQAAAAEKTIHFKTREIDSKAAFGEAVESDGVVKYPAFWTEGDDAVMISLNYEYAVTAGVNVSEQDEDGRIKRVTFDASFSGVETESPYRFYVVSPVSALLWASADREAVSIHVPANQTPSAKSVDENAMIIAASSDRFQNLPDEVDVDFKHITSYGKMTLTNLSVPAGASLTSVTLLCEDQPLSGSWYYKFGDGSVEEKESSSSIILNTENIDVAGGDPLWFACAPVGKGLAGKKLTIKANLDNGTALARTITLNPTVDYTSGKVTKFSVNMASAETVSQMEITFDEEVYELVSKVSDLAKGDEVIIVNSTSPTYAMTSSSSTSGLAATASGFEVGSDGYIRLSSGSSVLPLTISSISSSSVAFSDGGSSYLSYTSSNGSGPGSSGSRYLSLSSSSRTWTLSFSNGSASISSKGSGNTSSSTYYVRYNSNYFSLATSSSTVAIYKKVTLQSSAPADPAADPVFGHSDYGAYLSDRNLVYNATTDQLSREYGSDATLTFSILDPAEDQVVEFSGIPASGITVGGSFTLTLTFISGITTEIESSYVVTVVKEEGHKIWLTDGAGNGFIVKR